VPPSAVIDTGDRQVVLLVLGEGKYKPQPVKIGLRGREAVEILEGIQAGDEVVTAANFLIDAESNLKAALSTFTAPQSATTAKAAAKRYQAQGSIDSLDIAANTASVTHEPIPGTAVAGDDHGIRAGESRGRQRDAPRRSRCASSSRTAAMANS
jgi:Cu(I)/Ag(I) efflux system membrane fusion protein